ncbi:MAG: heat-inducible transcription repressor HrcA [Lachnospiraceae bacterium]|nr:heat-inducible transcription repressor HrcA [Lachnospiraceae bacterium]
MELDERKVKILQAIIRNYLETGEPVGSRTISKYTDLNLSSATIRNEMSDLEDMGYILQPHTSAGRIPSDKGYRLYVDSLLSEKEREVDDMKEVLVEKADKLETVLKQVAKLLADNTNYTTLVSKPRYTQKKIKFTQLTMISELQLLVVVVIDGNIVKNKFITLSKTIEPETLLQLNFLINTALNGLDLTEINMALIRDMKEQAGDYSELVGSILDSIAEAVGEEEEHGVYTSGATNLLRYPELNDRERATKLLTTLEEKETLSNWMNQDGEFTEHGIQVYIGEESPVEAMRDCAVVTATYQIEEGVYGKIGIVGPKRMDYERVVGTLESTMRQLDDIFKKK